LMLGQTGTSEPGPESADRVMQDLKALRETLAAQQRQIAEQQEQAAQQQKEIERLEQELTQRTSGTPHVTDATLRTAAPVTVATASATNLQNQGDQSKGSPLSFKIGIADFTPGGFIDFTSIFRSTNVGSGIGTSFGAVPFSNTIQGHLTENRFTAQNSRVSLKAQAKPGENDITGYVEADFLGQQPANVFVTSNSQTMRLRLYWADLKRGKWEILGGQAWSWLTPNRVGLSPVPADIFYSQNMDTNYQVGLTWTRAAQFRVAYHPNENWGLGVALENPEQFVGAGEVIFPFAFNAQLGVQFDAANNVATPNLHPDIIPKIAYDTDVGGKHFHIEAAGLLTTIKATVVPIGGTTFVPHSKTGGGASAAVNLELIKNFRVVANGFFSDGGGRYIFGLGPDAVIRPVATGATTFDINPSLVHTASGILGAEAQVTPKTLFAFYYGGAYFKRNFFADVTSPLVTPPFIGFGGPNSPNSANRAIQEGTIDWVQTFWKHPTYGSLQLITQYSYLTRSPWFVAAGAPKNAHASMGYIDLRYVLP